MKKKMILSVDTGIDDALAIVYAIGQQEMELIGITVSYGMSIVENTYRNTKKLVELLGAQVPVYMGSAVPIVRPGRDYKLAGSKIHGQDGMANQFGDYEPEDVAGAVVEESVDYIIDSIHTYGKELVLVTTGPMTDLARVITKEPGILDQIGAVYSMVGALAAPGNVNPYKEANAGMDPEAVKLVLETEPPLTVIGLDVTRKTLMSFADLKRWQAIGTGRSDFLAKLVEYYLDAYRVMHPYLKGCALHDPLAVGAALHPEWITTIPMHLTCVTEGEADGRTCENLEKCDDTDYHTCGALFVDSAAFEENFFATVENVLAGQAGA